MTYSSLISVGLIGYLLLTGKATQATGAVAISPEGAARISPGQSITPNARATSFRNSSDGSPWSTGTIEPHFGGIGYELRAQGYSQTNQLRETVLARLDSSVQPLWAVRNLDRLNMGVTTLKAHRSEPLVFASIEGLADEEFWTVFGLFNPLNGSRLFERGVKVTVETTGPYPFPQTAVQTGLLSDGRTTLILAASDSVVRLAVLGVNGEMEWNRSLASPAFRIDARGQYPTLIEAPDGGMWLIVRGSQKLSTQSNPPPINYAMTLSVLRFSATGDLLWSRQIKGLSTSSAIPDIGPAEIGTGGTLIFSLTDAVHTATNPAPNEFISYTVLLETDGTLRWARRIRGVAGSGLVPRLSPDNKALFCSGHKLKSLSSLSVDGMLLKLDPQSGESLAQISIDLGPLDYLTVAGISSNRVFVRALKSSLTTLPTAFVGSLTLDLQNGAWQQLTTRSITDASLSYEPHAGQLLFSDFHGDSVDAIPLDMNLNSLASGSLPGNPTVPCSFFTNTLVTAAVPGIIAEKIVISQSTLDVLVTAADIQLARTDRIRLQPFSPVLNPLCTSAPESSLPRLSWRLAPDTRRFSIFFDSTRGDSYELLFSPRLDQPMQPIEQVAGDDSRIERSWTVGQTASGFFELRKKPIDPSAAGLDSGPR